MKPPRLTKKQIDMSLRLWSERIPLTPIIKELGVAVSYVHVAGQAMASEGRLAGRTALRHYASVAKTKGEDDADVSAWCRQIIAKVDLQKSLVDLLLEGEIEGVLWIAVLGPEPSPMPSLPADIVNTAAQLKLKILLENYTNLSGEVPEKLWLSNDHRVD
jgi:hypothetical protein